jgi:hypothetical protein
MKLIAIIGLLAFSLSSFASLQCTAVVRNVERTTMTTVELVKVTAMRHKEEYLGKLNDYWFLARHTLGTDMLYMDIVNPQGDLATSKNEKISKPETHLVLSEGPYEIDFMCEKMQ